MRNAEYGIAAFMIVSVLVTWTLRRFVERLREPLGVVNGLALRLCGGVVVALVAAQAAIAGGYALIIVPLLAVLALWEFTLTAGIIWVWGREGLNDSD